MTSFIVVSKDPKKRDKYIQTYCESLSINPIDITRITKETSAKTTQSIGIEDIKNMQQKISLKPIKSDTKAVVLQDAQLLTSEAQNALLKVLEEPPDHTIIMLSTENRDVLLATIISRCKVIVLETHKVILSEDEIKEYEEFIISLSELTIGERLKKAEILAKDKEKSIIWIEKLLLALHDKLIDQAIHEQKSPIRYAAMLRAFQNLSITLRTTNVNARFALEQIFLTFLR